MKHSEIIEELKKHPKFFKMMGDHALVFGGAGDNVAFYLQIHKKEKRGTEFPIIWNSNENFEGIHETPKWFRELYLSAHHLYFDDEEDMKMKLILEPTYKRNKVNILFITAVEEGVQTDSMFEDNLFDDKVIRIEKHLEKYVDKAIKNLEKAGYKATTEESEEFFHLAVKE